MNREIKFRAWDKEESEMLQDSEAKFYLTQGLEADFMQYTGLNDKNNKEIYEGDICQIMLRRKYGHQLDNIPATVGAVEFGRICLRDDSLYVYNAFHINQRSIEYLLQQELEVIGNIYENSELLNK